MEIPHVQKHISRDQLFFFFFFFFKLDGTQEEWGFFFFSVWKFSEDLGRRGTPFFTIKGF